MSGQCSCAQRGPGSSFIYASKLQTRLVSRSQQYTPAREDSKPAAMLAPHQHSMHAARAKHLSSPLHIKAVPHRPWGSTRASGHLAPPTPHTAPCPSTSGRACPCTRGRQQRMSAFNNPGSGQPDIADRILATLPFLLPLLDALPYCKCSFLLYIMQLVAVHWHILA